MQLETGYRFRVAPRFAKGLSWNERLQVGGASEAAPGPPSEPIWRPATESEISILVSEETSPDAWRQDVSLFTLAEHLRARWWEMAARRVEAQAADVDGMEPFARAIAEFAQFKGLPLPRQCGFEITLTSPADPTTTRRAAETSSVLARVNLGDERTALVLVNLRPSRIDEMLEEQRHAAGSASVTQENDPVGSFRARVPEYPLVRVLLDPGEGIWLPQPDLLYSEDRSNQDDFDVWLVLKDEGRKDEG